MNTEVIALTYFALCVVLFVRNLLVGAAMKKRINEIHTHNQSAIDRGDYAAMVDYKAHLRGYAGALFDPTAWTYRQFFPQRIGSTS